jgi:hypothetical protein
MSIIYYNLFNGIIVYKIYSNATKYFPFSISYPFFFHVFKTFCLLFLINITCIKVFKYFCVLIENINLQANFFETALYRLNSAKMDNVERL